MPNPKERTICVNVSTFVEWFDALNEGDHRNFVALIDLPNALSHIERMKESEYKEMALFALAVLRTKEKLDADT